MQNFYLIGLIGNLGSGKSTVRKMLEQLGARGIDADALAHVVMQRGSPTWRKIVEEFGVEILTYDGRINRHKLGTRVFADASALRKLEALIHPAVREATKELLRETNKSVVVIEAIKLVEADMHSWCDALWAVTCTPEAQIERVTRTRHMREENARARLAAQGSIEDKLHLANVVIDNSGNEQATRAQVLLAWSAIRLETARDKSEWLFGKPLEALPVTPAVEPAPVVEPTSLPAPPPAPEPTSPASVMEQIVAPPPLAAPKAPPQFEVRRTRRGDLDALAVALAKRENRPQPLSHAEALKRFGELGYRIAMADGRIVAFAAWEAENLVASVREVWAESNHLALLALPKLFALIEEEARTLLCEVVLVFFEVSAPLFISEQARTSGYQLTELNALYHVWQQVARDRLKPGERIWAKRLREELITKPV